MLTERKCLSHVSVIVKQGRFHFYMLPLCTSLVESLQRKQANDGYCFVVMCILLVKSAYELKWPIRPELIPVSVVLSD